jgi:hypothetical protein
MTKDDGTLDVTVYFKPRPLENLLLVDELTSMSPLTDAKVRIYWSSSYSLALNPSVLFANMQFPFLTLGSQPHG